MVLLSVEEARHYSVERSLMGAASNFWPYFHYWDHRGDKGNGEGWHYHGEN